MPVATIDVDPDTYVSVGERFLAVNGEVCDAVADAAGAAGVGGGMAGTDSGGVDWAAGYDDAAGAALTTGATLADTLGHLAALLTLSGGNHANADAASVPGQPSACGPAVDTAPGAASVIPAVPPSADGTDDDPPPGWFLVAHLLQYTWPNGHQDRLRAVGAGWTAAAGDLDACADRLSGPIGDVSRLRAPEVDAAVTTCTDVQLAVRALASAYAELGSSCADYADRLDEAHSGVIDALVEFVAESAVIQIVSGIAASATAGGSEVAGQAAQTARTAATASRVAKILGELDRFVRLAAGVIRTVVTRIAEVATRLRTDLAKGASRAVGRVAAKLPSTLTGRLDRAAVFRGRNLPTEGGPPNGYLVKRAADGTVTNYMAYDANGLAIKRVDLTGRTHAGIPAPHVVDYGRNPLPDGTVRAHKGPVRPARPEEIP